MSRDKWVQTLIKKTVCLREWETIEMVYLKKWATGSVFPKHLKRAVHPAVKLLENPHV